MQRHAVGGVVAPGQQARARSASTAPWCGIACSAARGRRSGSCSASRSGRRTAPSPRSRRRPARCRARSAHRPAPSAGRYGSQSGTESVMSMLMTPLNGLAMARRPSATTPGPRCPRRRGPASPAPDERLVLARDDLFLLRGRLGFRHLGFLGVFGEFGVFGVFGGERSSTLCQARARIDVHEQRLAQQRRRDGQDGAGAGRAGRPRRSGTGRLAVVVRPTASPTNLGWRTDWTTRLSDAVDDDDQDQLRGPGRRPAAR